MKLSATRVKALRDPGRYSDRDGLHLVISRTGDKRWVQRITVGGRRRDIGLGGYPAVSLAQARKHASDNREAIGEGGDPTADKRRPSSALDQMAPVALEDERFTVISASKGNACGPRENGAAGCWGEGERDEESSPPAGVRFTKVSAGYEYGCGLLASGAIRCWGAMSDILLSDERFTAISSGAYHTCASREDGTAVCWGSDFYGEASPPE